MSRGNTLLKKNLQTTKLSIDLLLKYDKSYPAFVPAATEFIKYRRV